MEYIKSDVYCIGVFFYWHGKMYVTYEWVKKSGNKRVLRISHDFSPPEEIKVYMQYKFRELHNKMLKFVTYGWWDYKWFWFSSECLYGISKFSPINMSLLVI